MPASADLQVLIAQLDRQRETYLETFKLVRELLQADGVTRPGALDDRGPIGILRETNATPDSLTFAEPPATPNRTSAPVSTAVLSFESSSASRCTGDESDDERDSALYVQEALKPQSYYHEGLRDHLRSYGWDFYGERILDGVINDPTVMCRKVLFPTSPTQTSDGSHMTHVQVFDISSDGSPLEVDVSRDEEVTSKATAVWHSVKDINPQNRQRKAVGRITVVREPSPILFGALHYALSKTFDMDEIFKHLVSPDSSSAHVHRTFQVDQRRQRSFLFVFEYFTIIGDDRTPMKWQLADRQEQRKPSHIAITRCSAVVGLSLQGRTIKKIRNPLRRATSTHGYVYDPWAPYHVLNLQCFPDWRATTTTHDSTKHYVNGVEAFMVTLLSEFEDAQRRFEAIYRRMTRLVTPPLDFMFNPDLRDRLLFEDNKYTYSRRYFWAYQTMGIMIDSIKSMINAFEDNFTDDVWLGQHSTLWPMIDENSHRSEYYKKKMATLKPRFEAQIRSLKKLILEYEARRSEVTSLRDQLFSGTSVLESRKSVEQAEITVTQGHNIKLLTLVSIFFLPLTFVTSVFGMSNMPQAHHYNTFAIVTVAVCIPFFVLVGSLNTTQGMQFFRLKVKNIASRAGERLKRVFKVGKQKDIQDSESDGVWPNTSGVPMRRTISNQEDIAMRNRRWGHNADFENTHDEDAEFDSQTKLERLRTETITSKEPKKLVEMLQHESRVRKHARYSSEV